MKLLPILALWCSAALADPRYMLVLMVYSTGTGHHNDFRSYRDVVRLPGFSTLADCDSAGKIALSQFRAERHPDDLTQDLLDYLCLPTPETKTEE